MDGFASAGYTALGMDYFRGDPISKYRNSKNDPLPPGFDHAAWRTKHSTFANETVPKWTAAVKERFGAELKAETGKETRFACVGYCFGAPYVCNLLAGVGGDGEPVVSAGAFAHPTALKEEHFTGLKKLVTLLFLLVRLCSLAIDVAWARGQAREDISIVAGMTDTVLPEPLLLSCAENDQAFPAESRRKAVDVLQREGKVYHLQLFQGVGHGFAVKGDPSDPYQRE
ncbi:dienelactone hydrolase [Colletotrichum tofieldiae]|nr:dienelactone hydrolase [Colletotrichum tofieldiae]